MYICVHLSTYHLLFINSDSLREMQQENNFYFALLIIKQILRYPSFVPDYILISNLLALPVIFSVNKKI